jgi:DNA polymerase III alpha subunit
MNKKNFLNGLGKHASGIVVSSEDIGSIAPLVLDKDHQTCNIGFEMNAAESCGLVKFDILGLSLMSKIQGVTEILRHGEILSK